MEGFAGFARLCGSFAGGFYNSFAVVLWHFSGDSKCNFTLNLTGSLMTVCELVSWVVFRACV